MCDPSKVETDVTVKDGQFLVFWFGPRGHNFTAVVRVCSPSAFKKQRTQCCLRMWVWLIDATHPAAVVFYSSFGTPPPMQHWGILRIPSTCLLLKSCDENDILGHTVHKVHYQRFYFIAWIRAYKSSLTFGSSFNWYTNTRTIFPLSWHTGPCQAAAVG